MLTLEERKEKIIENIDPDFFIEAYNISIEELVEAFEDHILSNWETFEYLEEEEEEYGP